jgi:hypothetical protein
VQTATPSAQNLTPRLLPAELARVKNVSLATVRRWRLEGCPCERLSERTYRYDLASVTAWLNARSQPSEIMLLVKAIKHHIRRGGFRPSPSCSEVTSDQVILRNTVGDEAVYAHFAGMRDVRFVEMTR